MNNNLIGKHKAGQGAGEFKSLVSFKCSDSVSLSAKSHQNYMHVKNQENHVFRPVTVKVCFWASCTLHWTLWLLLLQKGIAFIGEWWFLSDCFNYFNLSSVLVTQRSFIPFIWMFATSNTVHSGLSINSLKSDCISFHSFLKKKCGGGPLLPDQCKILKE